MSEAWLPPPIDCVVIGSGPGGYVAAIRAAQLGMKTAVVEKDVDRRPLPERTRASRPRRSCASPTCCSEIRDADEFGIKVGEPTVDFGAVGERRKKVIKTLTGGVAGLMKKNEIDVIEGYGSLTGRRQRQGRRLRHDRGQGASSSPPARCKRPIPGLEFGGRVIGTEEAWALEELPEEAGRHRRRRVGHRDRLAPTRAWLEVSLFEGLDRVLPAEDADISKLAERGFKKQGIEVHTKTFFDMEQHGTDADWLVIAAGRGPDVEGLGPRRRRHQADRARA